MTAYELCKFCRDNRVEVIIYPDWVVDGSQAITMCKYPEDGTPPLKYRYVFDADYLRSYLPEEKADKYLETVLRNGLNAINKMIREGGKNGE